MTSSFPTNECRGSPQTVETETVYDCIPQSGYAIELECSTGTITPTVALNSLYHSFQVEHSTEELNQPSEPQEIIHSNEVVNAHLVRMLANDDHPPPTQMPTKAPSGFGSTGYFMQTIYANIYCIGGVSAISSITAVPVGICINNGQSSYVIIYTDTPGAPSMTTFTYLYVNCIGAATEESSFIINSVCEGGYETSYVTELLFPDNGYTTRYLLKCNYGYLRECELALRFLLRFTTMFFQ